VRDGDKRRDGRAAGTPIARSTLVCTVCGASEEVELDVLALLGRSIVRSLGAELASHRIELRGRCGACCALATPRSAWGEA
jgi:Fe2+ or Zn2+ uptake regulation protein